MTERNFCAAHIYENLLGMEHALGAGGSQAGRGEAYREQSGRLEQNLQAMAVMAADSERLIGYVQQIDGFQRSQERLWRETDGGSGRVRLAGAAGTAEALRPEPDR